MTTSRLAIQDEKSQKKASPTPGIVAIVEKEGRKIHIGSPGYHHVPYIQGRPSSECDSHIQNSLPCWLCVHKLKK
jgi:hypothetical protein